MDRFLNALKAHAGAMDQAQGRPRFGIVSSVDPNSYTARVMLQPENVLTGWLPVLSPWSGAGWGMVCPPSPGDQVLVLPQDGDAEHGVIVGRSFSATAQPPTGPNGPAPSGELWLQHASGSVVRLGNDGTVTINAQGMLSIAGTSKVAVAASEIDLDAAAVRGGNVAGSMQRLATESFVLSLFNTHTHADAQGGQTGAPLQQAGSQHLTSNFEAS